jgi:hypothetical protein
VPQHSNKWRKPVIKISSPVHIHWPALHEPTSHESRNPFPGNPQYSPPIKNLPK